MTKRASFSVISSLIGIVACALLGGSGAKAAPYVDIIDQVGNNVVVSGSGDIDTTGLTQLFPGVTSPTTQVNGAFGIVTLSPQSGFTSRWTGPMPIQPIGTNATSFTPDSQTGTGPFSFTGFPSAVAASANLFLPASCGPNAVCPVGPATATYDNRTVGGMGLTVNTYTWTWGAGPDQRITISVVPGPIVGAGLPGLIAALGGLVAMARRRRKQLA